MSKTKCIIRQDWTTRDASGNLIDRHAAVYVTNEDGTPTIYDSIKEARAEIIANYGRDANRAGILHSHSVDDYTGNVHDGYVYIVRENDLEYTEAIEQAKQDAAPEYIEPEAIQTVSGNTIYRSTDPVTNEIVFTVAGRDFWTVAEARYFAQCNPVTTDDAADAEELKDTDAYAKYARAFADTAEYAEAHDDPETARKCADAAHEAAGNAAASYEYSRATYYADHQTSAYSALALEIRAEQVEDAKQAADRAEAAAQRAEQAETAAALKAFEASRPSLADIRAKYDSPWLEWDTVATYQPAELLAYLGEPEDYDVEAIEAEATAYDPATGARIWVAFGDDLAAIAERHQTATYYPAAV